VHTISVIIPVYGGEFTLEKTVLELLPLATDGRTPGGVAFVISEIILVDDKGLDASDTVIRHLAAANPIVRAVWLSRNYGQHAATLAGMADSTSDWVVTVDEDGQYDPSEIGSLLDTALDESVQVVYGRPLNPVPQGTLRGAASHLSKWLVKAVSGSRGAPDFNSFRLVLGSTARSVAELAGPGVYLDIALGWIAGRHATVGVTLRGEQRKSGYSTRTLVSHFWRMVISSGTRVLRMVSFAGVLLALLGIIFAVWIICQKLFLGINSAGWASTMVVLLLGCGAILFALGVIAEFMGAILQIAMGKPAFHTTVDPEQSPLKTTSDL
jgi:glycosyltransferase involved in cell wall biosynthesis